MAKKLSRLLSRFTKVRALVVGDLMADHYVYGQTERVSREAPVLIVRHQDEEVKLGGGANAAANARSLGAQVTALGVLGRDGMGEHLGQLFKDQGITLATESSRGVPTETKTRILAGAHSTTRQQMLRIDRGAPLPLPTELRKKLARRIEKEAAKADVIIVSDYGAGVIGEETRGALLRQARLGKRVCADSRFQLTSWAGATVCKPNEPELAAITGMPVGTEGEVMRAGIAALERLHCDVLLVTRGRHGMVVFYDGQATFLPVHGVEDAVDVTGAGDTVHATFAIALAAGANPVEAAHLANVAGGLVVQKLGTATLSREELADELAAYGA
ncbi:MAG: bifunctional ADP-heptose synthase [Myxococcaceae bacterium]